MVNPENSIYFPYKLPQKIQVGLCGGGVVTVIAEPSQMPFGNESVMQTSARTDICSRCDPDVVEEINKVSQIKITECHQGKPRLIEAIQIIRHLLVIQD